MSSPPHSARRVGAGATHSVVRVVWQARGVGSRRRRTGIVRDVPPLLVGFDTETTGLDVAHDRAISYGVYVWRLGAPPVTEHFYVTPDREISEGARRVHGLDREALEDLRASSDVLAPMDGARRALGILGEWADLGGVVVGANVAGFDLAMLRATLLDLGGHGAEVERLDSLEVYDVIEHDLAIEPSREARPRRTLAHLCRHYQVPPGGHDALGDARAAVEVFLRQVEVNRHGQMTLAGEAEPRW